MAVGTALGGWRIVKTMGMRIVKLKPIGGFCAEISGAFTLFIATHFGIPVSTTHTIVGSIVGVGTITHPLSKIKWQAISQYCLGLDFNNPIHSYTSRDFILFYYIFLN